MRVLFLNPLGELGGAETSLLVLLGALRHLHPDWELQLLLGSSGPLEARARELGISVEVLAFPDSIAGIGESGGEPIWRKAIRALSDLWRYRRELERSIESSGADIIHSNGLKMHLLGAICRRGLAKQLCHIHDYISTRRITRYLMTTFATRFDVIVANSKDVAEDCERWAGRSASTRFIYNAIDSQRFKPEGGLLDLDQASGLSPAAEGTVRVGLIATFAHWKGHRTFLEAAAKAGVGNQARFYVIGGPIYMTGGSQHSLAELRDEAAKLGIADRVGFTGFLRETPLAIRSLDVVVHASTKPEPFGMVIVEGMACRRAVIVANAGGASELFEDGSTGLGHTPGDSDSLAAAIRRVVQDRELREGIAERGYLHCQNCFQAERMGRQFSEAYQFLVSRSFAGAAT